eukprot:2015908-Pleurochrysis_carterae.AAC.2
MHDPPICRSARAVAAAGAGTRTQAVLQFRGGKATLGQALPLQLTSAVHVKTNSTRARHVAPALAIRSSPVPPYLPMYECMHAARARAHLLDLARYSFVDVNISL